MAYGDAASCGEGGNSLPIFSPHTDSYQRSSDGCQDTNVTIADWSATTRMARNAFSQGNVCACQQ
jgi:hypothetical protein